MDFAKDLLIKLHRKDIYKEYEPEYSLDLHGGYHPDIYKELFDEIKPSVVFEVGSWKGRSAIFFAKMLKKQKKNSVLVCIDTWLGGVEHLPPEITEKWSIYQYRENGYPKLYYQFLSNIIREGVENIIVPFPNTSNIAAKWLAVNSIKADLIYIDASHEYQDVMADLYN